jgi:cell division protein FtsI (penicillin-binding protein 3)
LAAARLVLVLALVAAGLKLVQVQGFEARDLQAQSARQRTTREVLPAERGPIDDRNGVPMAFSVEVDALYAQPKRIAEDQRRLGRDPAARYDQLADGLSAALVQAGAAGQVAASPVRRVGTPSSPPDGTAGPPATDQASLRARLRGLFTEDRTFVYLVDQVDPGLARTIREALPELGTESREARRYPGGTVAANIIGVANWRMDQSRLGGLAGLEATDENILAGTQGQRIVDTAAGSDAVIPGSERGVVPAVPGSGLELTLDSDVQYKVQQILSDAVTAGGAKDGDAVVLDAHTGEVIALATDKTFDPNDRSTFDPAVMGDPPVSSPFEPGSVNKVVTASAAIEYGVTTPDTVISVPGSIRVADRTIDDAWKHGVLRLTFTGVLAKSSNVGTLMTAQKVGPDRYADMLTRFGLGSRTNVGLPGESPGVVPPRSQWSGSTFGNLPIGQGLSMTVLQMAGMYQTIANDGIRVPPRIVRAVIGPDGRRTEQPQPDGVRVVGPQTAATVRDMLRAVVQDQPGGQRGTGPAAALAGYQVAGKTGTAQQPDPEGGYSQSKYWITFAGMFPADSPRYVVGIMLDAPTAAHSAAPVFHDIAAYLGQHFQIPPSPQPSPIAVLQER